MTLQCSYQVAESHLTQIGTLTQLHGTFNKINFITLLYFLLQQRKYNDTHINNLVDLIILLFTPVMLCFKVYLRNSN